MSSESKYAYEVPGKLEIPYKYYAGECGSRFLIALRDKKKITATKCKKCKTVFVPPRSVCSRCYKRINEWVEVGPAGTVTSFTVVRYSEPHMPCRPPFVMAQIKLDGAGTDLTHIIRETDPEDVQIGMRVEAIWGDNRNARITDIAHFRPLKKKTKKAKPKKKAKPEKKAVARKKTKAPAKKKTAKKAVKKVVRKRAKKKVEKKKPVKKKSVKKTPKKKTKKAAGKKAKKVVRKPKKKKVVKKAKKKVAGKKPARKAAKKKSVKRPARKAAKKKVKKASKRRR